MRKNTKPAAYSRAAFTLIELLVVITIIGILVALLLGGIAKAYQHAINVQCQNNLGQLAKSVLAYTTAHRGAILPTMIMRNDRNVFWCNILAERDVDSQNMAVADQGQNSNETKVRTGQASVFLCPSSKSSDVYVPAGGSAWGKYAWSSPPAPTDDLANGWYRLGNQSGQNPVMTDCSYYWNGYCSTAGAGVGRFPSEVLDLRTDDPAAQARQIHDLSEIKMRSRMVMVADGVFFQGADIQGGGQDIRPEYIAAGRHPGTYAGGGLTNIAYYDGHVESMDRYPGPAGPNDWVRERVDGFRYDISKGLKESTDPTRPPLVPIMNTDLRTKLDLPPGDVKAGLGPVFMLPPH